MTSAEETTLWLGSCRYYIGRMSIGVSMFAQLLRREWPNLSPDTRGYIERDVEEAFVQDDKARAAVTSPSRHGNYPLGYTCDRDEWTRVRNLWRKPAGLWQGAGECPDCGQQATLCLCGHDN